MNFSILKEMRTLASKVTFLACGSAVLTALFVGGLNFLQTERITLETAISGLAGETRLMSQRFRASYEQLKNDAFVASQTPPIQGIVRSQGNGGRDPLDGSSTEAWRNRMAAIFTSIMTARPHYTQMRYIGVANGGRELVRVNRILGGLAVVPEAKLQNKGDESYFVRASALPAGKIYFSEVTYNREFGAVDQELVPTVRAALPIHNEEGALFGMIVINANYEVLIKQTFEEIAPDKDTFIINHAGDYMARKRNGAITSLQLGANYTTAPPSFIERIRSASTKEEAFIEEDFISYFVRLNVDQNNPEAFLGVVLQVPRDELLWEAYQTRWQSLILTSILLFMCVSFAMWMSRRLVAPLKKMTEEITGQESFDQPLDLPLQSNDEIGDLARAFQGMMDNVLESEAKVRAVIENAVDGILTIDRHARVDSFNPACERIFGYNAADIIGRKASMLISGQSEGRFGDIGSNGSQSGDETLFTGVARELVGERKDGSTFAMELSVSEMDIGDRLLFCAIVRDITDRKQMDIMKDEFISTVNHELRTPLTSIQAALGLLQAKSSEHLDAANRRLVELSFDNCKRLTFLVNDILDMEKISAGKMEYNLETTEMNGLVRDIVERHQSFADKHEVTMTVKEQAEKIFATVDRNRFNQALVNLLSNAAKFSPAGSEVIITTERKGDDMLQVSVSDKGPGIPENFRSKIFEKFSQADGSSRRSKGGTGLGLNITKSIIEAFGGTVDFDTREGEGTTFYFVLPVENHVTEAA